MSESYDKIDVSDNNEVMEFSEDEEFANLYTGEEGSVDLDNGILSVKGHYDALKKVNPNELSKTYSFSERLSNIKNKLGIQ